MIITYGWIFIITAIWRIKSPCQTWAGAFVIPLTSMNLEPFSTLLLIQTLFVHGEQAPDFANNFQAHVSSLAFPAEMTSPIMHWLERFYFNHFALRYFKFTCTINQRKWPIIFSFKCQGVSFLIIMLCENFNMLTWCICCTDMHVTFPQKRLRLSIDTRRYNYALSKSSNKLPSKEKAWTTQV